MSVEKVVLKGVLRADMHFHGELIGNVSSQSSLKCQKGVWTKMSVYKIVPHAKARHPSNEHAGKFIVVIVRHDEDSKEEKTTYVHCTDAQEVVNALHQPRDNGEFYMTVLSRKLLQVISDSNPDLFTKTIKE